MRAHCPTGTGIRPSPAPAPCTCPCTRMDWHALAHDAKQLHAYMQKVQTQDEVLHYMKFYLLRFAALIASACVQPRMP